jgi:hypothetical protein
VRRRPHAAPGDPWSTTRRRRRPRPFDDENFIDEEPPRLADGSRGVQSALRRTRATTVNRSPEVMVLARGRLDAAFSA